MNKGFIYTSIHLSIYLYSLFLELISLNPWDGSDDVNIPADQQQFVKHSCSPSDASKHVHCVQSHINPTLCPAVTLALSFHVCTPEYTELQPLNWLISSQHAWMSNWMLKSAVVEELKSLACSGSCTHNANHVDTRLIGGMKRDQVVSSL